MATEWRPWGKSLRLREERVEGKWREEEEEEEQGEGGGGKESERMWWGAGGEGRGKGSSEETRGGGGGREGRGGEGRGGLSAFDVKPLRQKHSGAECCSVPGPGTRGVSGSLQMERR